MSEQMFTIGRPAAPRLTGELLGKVALRGGEGEHGAAILAYHRVGTVPSPLTIAPWRFRQQMNYLRLHYRVVPLARLIADLRAGRRPTGPTVAITFDDGYRDNLTEAAPILAEFGLPATLFVATGPQTRGEPFWWDTLELAGITDPDILARLKTRPHEEFRLAIELARQQVSTDILSATVRHLYLTWDELRQWTALGHEVGAHTVTHPIMAQITAEQARAELRDSRAAIERETGHLIDTFAYPNGRAIDFTAGTTQILAEEGFVAACTTIDGLNDETNDPLALHRFCVRDEALPLFALRLSGHLGIVRQWLAARPS